MRSKTRNFYVALVCILSTSVCGQGIRKEWHEMTSNEKLSLMEAIHYTQSQFGTYFKMGNFHGQRFNEIHFNTRRDFFDGDNGTGEFLLDQFAAWHRWAIFTVERDLQKFQPELSMPFWDWSVYNTKSDEMWSATHLGQFNSTSNWFVNLGRSPTASTSLLGTASDITFVKGQTSWYNFNLQLEGGFTGATNVHPGGHTWTGGIMNGGNSPWDPVFFFHHNMVDKIWQEWVDAGGSGAYNVSLLSNTLGGDSHYLWPENVDPDNIRDSKDLGIFFATDQYVKLHDYSVTNAYRSNEVFFYQYTIEAGDNFHVPAGKTAEIKSYDRILLTTGFKADAGSAVKVKLVNESIFDTDCGCTGTSQLPGGRVAGISTTDAYEPVYTNAEADVMDIQVFPIPAGDRLTISGGEPFALKIYNINGIVVAEEEINVDFGQLDIDVSAYPEGVYLLKAISDHGEVTKQIAIKH